MIQPDAQIPVYFLSSIPFLVFHACRNSGDNKLELWKDHSTLIRPQEATVVDPLNRAVVLFLYRCVGEHDRSLYLTLYTQQRKSFIRMRDK